MALPAIAAASCRVCDAPAHPGFSLCYCCGTVARQLQMPLAPMVAVAEYQIGDRMHRRLRGYKDAPVREARARCAAALSSLLERWMAANRDDLHRRFGSRWDLVATVPSSCRPGSAPVDALVSRVPDLARCQRAVLVRGPEGTDHLRAARRGFTVAPAIDPNWLRRRSVLIFDDTVTTGARAQSAVAALRIAGARVVGVVAIGRVVDAGRVRQLPRVIPQARAESTLRTRLPRLPG